jgi:hypothetical protein
MLPDAAHEVEILPFIMNILGGRADLEAIVMAAT